MTAQVVTCVGVPSTDTTAVQTALNTGGLVQLSGVNNPVMNATLTFPANTPTWLRGEGNGVTVLGFSSTTGNGITATLSLSTLGGGISDMTIAASTTSTGAGVAAKYTNDGWFLHNVTIENFETGLWYDGCWDSVNEAITILNAKSSALNLTGPTASGTFRDFVMSNNGTAAAGLGYGSYISGDQGSQLDNVYAFDFNVGQYITNSNYTEFRGCGADTCAGDGWQIDPSVGLNCLLSFDRLWSGTNGGSGVNIMGTGNTKSLNFSSPRLINNAWHGMLVGVVSGLKVSGGDIMNNGQAAANTYSGIYFDGGSTGCYYARVIDNQIGNNVSISSVQQQYYSLRAPAVGSNFIIYNNDLSLFATGGAEISGTFPGTTQVLNL